jgi:hypothetical protein
MEGRNHNDLVGNPGRMTAVTTDNPENGSANLTSKI